MTSGLVACCATEEGTKLGLLIKTIAKGPKEFAEKGIEAVVEGRGIDRSLALILGGAAGELVNVVLPESQIAGNLSHFARERLRRPYYGLLRANPHNVPLMGSP